MDKVISGFDPANHTQVPNDLFDVHLPELSGAELKVILTIIRKTRGWHKEIDAVSYSQLVELTGLSRQSVATAISELENKKLLLIDREKKTSKYEINYYRSVKKLDRSKNPSVKKLDQTSQKSRPEIGLKSRHTKESIKETNKTKGARVNGCPVPSSLQQPEIVEAYQTFCQYLKENFSRWPTSTTTQIDLQKLAELQSAGNDPVKVIQQTIQARNKSFYPLRDFDKNSEKQTGKKYEEL